MKLLEWLTLMKKTWTRMEAIDERNFQTRKLLPEFEKVHQNNSTDNRIAIEFDLEDVQEEIDYCNSSLICYVLGANPPFPIIDGFLRRIWTKKGVDKIVVVHKGIFIVIFHNLEQRDAISNDDFLFFDRKPLIVKKWNSELNVQKEDV